MPSTRCRRRIRSAKKAARPELKGHEGWQGGNWQELFDTSHDAFVDNVQRVDYDTTSCEEFIEKFVVFVCFKVFVKNIFCYLC